MNSRQRQALGAANCDLFAAVPENLNRPPMPIIAEQLPSATELQAMFDLYNSLHFDDQLPRARVEYSRRMEHTAGLCIPARLLIRIGWKYHTLFPDEVVDTLKHEMIHLKHRHHDRAFRVEAARLNVSLKARSDPRLQRPARYVYRCPGCGANFRRQKRLIMASCGKCSVGGRFDERFKLILSDSARRREQLS